MKCSFGISNFLKEICSLSHSVVFLCIPHLRRISYLSLLVFGTLHLDKYILPFLLSFPFFSHLFCKASSDKHFALLQFFFLGMLLITASCTMLQTSVHSSSGTLSESLDSVCHFHCIITRDLIQVIPEWSSGFPHVLQYVWILQQGAHDLSHNQLLVLFFSVCIELLHLELQRIESVWFRYWPSGDVRYLLCCWKRLFAMTSAFSWQNSVSLCPASFCTPRPNLPVTPGIYWLPTFAFQSPMMKRTSFFGISSRRSCR